MKVKYEREDLVYGDGRIETGSYESEVNMFPREIVVKDGHFVSFLLRFSDVSSYGMSVTEIKKIGIVFIDGSTAGTTTQHYSNCSTIKCATEINDIMERLDKPQVFDVKGIEDTDFDAIVIKYEYLMSKPME